jgi:hypothetical protein
MLSTQDQLLLGGILNVKGLCVYLEYLDLTQFFLCRRGSAYIKCQQAALNAGAVHWAKYIH